VKQTNKLKENDKKEWEACTKAAITNQFFPNMKTGLNYEQTETESSLHW